MKNYSRQEAPACTHLTTVRRSSTCVPAGGEMLQAWCLLQLATGGQPLPANMLQGLGLPSTFWRGLVLLSLNPRWCRPLQAQQLCSRSQNESSLLWLCFPGKNSLGRESSCHKGPAGDILCVGTQKHLLRLSFFYPSPEHESLPKSVTLGCLRELGGVKAHTWHSFPEALPSDIFIP